MNRKQAEALANALMGEIHEESYWSGRDFVVRTDRSVNVDLSDGRAVRLDVDAGSVYSSLADRTAMENPETRELPWDSSEDWARDLAFLIGGEPWHSGGNIWLVSYLRPDGKWACISSDGAGIYLNNPRAWSEDESDHASSVHFDYH